MSLSTLASSLSKSSLFLVGGTLSVLATLGSSFYFSSGVSTFLLNKVKNQVPGLSWDKIEGSISGGLVITNLHYTSQSFTYNPDVLEVPLVEGEDGKERPAQKGEIPTLIEVTVPHAVVGLKLSCLLATKVHLCVDKFQADNAKVTLALGDATREDHYALEAYKNVSAQDLLPTLIAPESGGFPSWLDIELANAKVKEFDLVMGQNIGLAQLAINNKVIKTLEANPEADFDDLPFQATLAQSSYASLAPSSIYNGYLANPLFVKINSLTLAHLGVQLNNFAVEGLQAKDLNVDVLYNGDSAEVKAQKKAKKAAQKALLASQEEVKNKTPISKKDAKLGEGSEFDLVKIKDDLQNDFLLLLQQYFKLDHKPSLSFNTLESNLTKAIKDKPEVAKLLANSLGQRTTDANTTAQSSEIFTFPPRKLDTSKLPTLPSAVEISKQIEDAQLIFKQPLKDFIIDKDNKLKLPIRLTLTDLGLTETKVLFHEYSNLDYVEELRSLAQQKADLLAPLPSYIFEHHQGSSEVSLADDNSEEAQKALASFEKVVSGQPVENTETNPQDSNLAQGKEADKDQGVQEKGPQTEQAQQQSDLKADPKPAPATKEDLAQTEATKPSTNSPANAESKTPDAQVKADNQQALDNANNSLLVSGEDNPHYRPPLFLAPTLVSEEKDSFYLSKLSAKAILTPEELNVEVNSKGDLESKIKVSYLNTLLEGNANIAIKKLPLTPIPYQIKSLLTLDGKLTEKVNLSLAVREVQAEQANIEEGILALDATFNTAQSQWPLTLEVVSPKFIIAPFTYGPLALTVTGQADNLEVDFNSYLATKENLYFIGLDLGRLNNKLTVKSNLVQLADKSLYPEAVASNATLATGNDNKAQPAQKVDSQSTSLSTTTPSVSTSSSTSKEAGTEEAKVSKTVNPVRSFVKQQVIKQIPLAALAANSSKHKDLLSLTGNMSYGEELVVNLTSRLDGLRGQNLLPGVNIKNFSAQGDFLAHAVYREQRDWSALFDFIYDINLDKDPVKGQVLGFADSHRGLYLPEVSMNYLTNKVAVAGKIRDKLTLDVEAKVNNLKTFVPELDINLDTNLHFVNKGYELALKGLVDIDKLKYQTLNVHQGLADINLNYNNGIGGYTKISLAPSTVGDLDISQALLHYKASPYDSLDVNIKSSLVNLDSHFGNFIYYPNGDFFTSLVIKNLDVIPANLYKLKTLDPINLEVKTLDAFAKVYPFTLENKDLSLSNRKELIFVDNNLSGKVELSKIDLSFINSKLKEADTNVKGLVSAILDFDLDVSDLPKAENKVNLAINSKAINVQKGNSFSSLKANIDNLLVKASLANNNLNLNVDADIERSPLRSNLKVKKVFSEQRALGGNISLKNFSLDLIRPLLDNTQVVQGLVSLNLNLGGHLLKPELFGKASINKLKVAMATMPFEVKDGTLTLDFKGEKALVSGLLPTNSTPITLGGNVNWANYNNPQAKVEVKARDLKAQVLEFGSLLLNTGISAEYNNNSLVVRGEALVHDALLKVSTGGKSYLQPSSDVVIVNNQGSIIDDKGLKKKKLADLENKQVEVSSPLNIDARLKLGIGRNTVFDAFGVNANLRGALGINFINNALSLNGAITIPRGIFQQYGQSLIIKKGTAVFNGVSVIPNLDISAIRNPDFVLDNVEVGVQVRGPATQPRITLFSNPNLPESQKINYLLTGSASDNSDGEVGLQLLSSTLSSSLSSSISLIGQIGEAFGIKHLQLGTAKSGSNSQVTLSGTVFNKVRLNYAYGLFTGLTEISGSYRVLPEIFLRLSYGLSAAIDAVWSRSW